MPASRSTKTCSLQSRVVISSRVTEIPSTLDQHQQEIHRLPPQSHLMPPATELVAGGVELEVPEAERHAGGGCPHECGGQYDVITG